MKKHDATQEETILSNAIKKTETTIHLTRRERWAIVAVIMASAATVVWANGAQVAATACRLGNAAAAAIETPGATETDDLKQAEELAKKFRDWGISE